MMRYFSFPETRGNSERFSPGFSGIGGFRTDGQIRLGFLQRLISHKYTKIVSELFAGQGKMLLSQMFLADEKGEGLERRTEKEPAGKISFASRIGQPLRPDSLQVGKQRLRERGFSRTDIEKR